MWAFFSRRFRRWMVLAVGLPAAAWLLERFGSSLESRRGESGLSRGLRGAGGWLGEQRSRRGRWLF